MGSPPRTVVATSIVVFLGMVTLKVGAAVGYWVPLIPVGAIDIVGENVGRRVGAGEGLYEGLNEGRYEGLGETLGE